MMFVFILLALAFLLSFVTLWMKGLLSFLMLAVILFMAFELDQPRKEKGKK